jgi:hypothetical protein
MKGAFHWGRQNNEALVAVPAASMADVPAPNLRPPQLKHDNMGAL